MSVVEVELRSFVTADQYARLKAFFDADAQFEKEDYQETGYFDCPQDLRIQSNGDGGKVWLKKGELHDDAREEIEVHFTPDKYNDYMHLFTALGYGIEIMWYRTRREYTWRGISVMLDDTRGYGQILELEKLTDDAGKDAALAQLHAAFQKLEIPITPAADFKARFAEYKANWRALTQTAA